MTLIADWNINNPVTYARMRATMLESGGGLQEGVIGANDLKVAQRGAGANMSVDVPTGAAWVQIDTGTRNGLGHVYNDATANVTVTASNGTNPRIDQIILRWNDTSIPTGSGNVPTLEVLTGTATSGATLDNRTGAAALPNDCLRLADLLIPTSSTSVTTANIRDRRPWARGAYCESNGGVITAGPFYGGTGTGTLAGLTQRVEFSGAPVVIESYGHWIHQGIASTQYNVFLFAVLDATASNDNEQLLSTFNSNLANSDATAHGRITLPAPAAGTHTVDIRLAASPVTPSIGINHYGFRVWEMPRQFSNNGTS